MTNSVMQCYDRKIMHNYNQAIASALIVDVGSEHWCVGVLYFESNKTF